MALEELNLGTDPTGEGGDTLREAMEKIKTNFGLLTEPGSITSLFTTDVDGAGKLLYDLVMQGFRDRPYDLSVDSLGLNVGGTVTLIDGLNVVVHPEVTTALTIALPTPAAGEAPFGVVSYLLGAGGSVALAATPAYQWEKVNLTDDGPTLPTAEGSVAHLHYRWDVISESYLVTVTRSDAEYTPPPSAVELLIVENSMTISSLSVSNRSTHTTTHTFQSTTQDDTVLLIFGFISDSSSGDNAIALSEPASGATLIHSTNTGAYGARIYWYWYKPSQSELNTGTITLEFTYSNQVGQIVSFEVSGADTTNPVHTTADDFSNSSRSTVGPATLSVTEAGALLVACLGTDDSNGSYPVTESGTTGWSEVVDYQPGVAAVPNIVVYTMEDSSTGSIDTPTFNLNAADTAQLVAFAIKPADDA